MPIECELGKPEVVVGNADDEGDDSERCEKGGIRVADDKEGREEVFDKFYHFIFRRGFNLLKAFF